jgi:hypothetical protein
MVVPVLGPPVLWPSAEPEPGRNDGGSCCSPGGGSHVPGVRRGPAALSARGVLAASVRRRGWHHTGAAALPRPRPTRVRTACGLATVGVAAGRGPSGAMAPLNARRARARAPPPRGALGPRALRCRERVSRRTGACPLGKVPRTPPAGQDEGVAPGGCAALPGRCGQQGRGDAPAARAWVGASTGEPSATRAGGRDQAKGGAVGLPPPAARRAGTWSGPQGAEGATCGPGLLHDRGDGQPSVRNIQTDGEGASLLQG